MKLKNAIRKSLIFLIFLAAVTAASHLVFAGATDDTEHKPVVIGFIDSGISTCNLDASHVLAGKNYVFANGDTLDRIGHGTKTAGMVLGSADGSVPGIFPDAYLVPLVVVDKYASGVTSNGGPEALIAAIYDAVDVFCCDIINISLSTTDGREELNDAINYAYEKGVIVVASAGNTPDNRQTYYPAHYENVITIGASNGSAIADFSSTADVDFYYEGTDLDLLNCRQGKVSVKDSGTSFSCAAVSGICAAWLAEDPLLTYPDIVSLLVAHSLEGTANILEPYCKSAYSLDQSEIVEIVYQDIDGFWCEEAVKYALEEGLVAAWDERSFKPDAYSTRAVVVNALYHLSGAPQPVVKSVFPDVSPEAWYSDAVAWAADAGLVSGYTNGNFGPDDNITREQLCTVFCKYAVREGIELAAVNEKLEFADASGIAEYAKAYVGICQQAGIVSGKPGNRFEPKGNATRAQFCAMLMNFTDR